MEGSSKRTRSAIVSIKDLEVGAEAEGEAEAPEEAEQGTGAVASAAIQ